MVIRGEAEVGRFFAAGDDPIVNDHLCLPSLHRVYGSHSMNVRWSKQSKLLHLEQGLADP
jgi:hypothetical protein